MREELVPQSRVLFFLIGNPAAINVGPQVC